MVLFTALTGMWHYKYELAHQALPVASASKKPVAKPQVSSATSEAVPTNITESGTHVGGNTTVKKVTNPEQSNVVTSSGSVSAGSTGAVVASSGPSVVQVSLSVNGAYKGAVSLSSGSTQCDVLAQALKSGVISSLDMRYSSQYGTYGVYVIDGLGDSASIWWTYTVNGHSPAFGCSGTTVHSGDSTNWQYVKT